MAVEHYARSPGAGSRATELCAYNAFSGAVRAPPSQFSKYCVHAAGRAQPAACHTDDDACFHVFGTKRCDGSTKERTNCPHPTSTFTTNQTGAIPTGHDCPCGGSMCPSTWSNDPSCGANTSAKEHGAAHHACGTNCTNAHAHKAGACAWIPSNCPGAAGGATSQARTDGPKQQRGHASFPGANASTAFPESFCMDKPSSWRDVFPGSQWQATSRAAENSVHDCTPASCSGSSATASSCFGHATSHRH